MVYFTKDTIIIKYYEKIILLEENEFIIRINNQDYYLEGKHFYIEYFNEVEIYMKGELSKLTVL